MTTGFTLLDAPLEGKEVVTDFALPLAELQRIREQGHATLDAEFEAGVVGASAPVYDLSGRIVAALNVSAPTSRIGGQLDTPGSTSRAPRPSCRRISAARREPDPARSRRTGDGHRVQSNAPRSHSSRIAP